MKVGVVDVVVVVAVVVDDDGVDRHSSSVGCNVDDVAILDSVVVVAETCRLPCGFADLGSFAVLDLTALFLFFSTVSFCLLKLTET